MFGLLGAIFSIKLCKFKENIIKGAITPHIIDPHDKSSKKRSRKRGFNTFIVAMKTTTKKTITKIPTPTIIKASILIFPLH